VSQELDYVKSKEALDFVATMGTCAPKDPSTVFAAASDQALDLMLKMLTMYPPHRITVDAAMAHAYFDDVRDQYDDEDPVLPAEFEFEFEKMDLSLEDYRGMIREEALSFKRERQERSRRRRDRHAKDGFTSGAGSASSSRPSEGASAAATSSV
jgi:serine/threonine protein kinase